MNTLYAGLELIEYQLQEHREHLPPQLLDNLQAMKTSCRTSVNILDDLLTFEKLESGILNLDRRLMAPKPVIDKVLSPFFLQAVQEDIDLSVDYEDSREDLDTLNIDIDLGKFSQVLRNLASNAIKFTPSGGRVTVNVRVLDEYMFVKRMIPLQSEPRVSIYQSMRRVSNMAIHPDPDEENSKERFKRVRPTISVNRGAAEGSISMKKLRIEFVDSGSGIAPENLHKLFREGVQIDATLNQGGGGSGMGLFISKRIMDLHGGVIGVTSEGLGHGCTFFIEIPLVEMPPSLHSLKPNDSVRRRPQSHSHHKIELVENSPPSGKQYSFLVVDDSSPTRKMMLQLLTALGHTCTQAVHGEDAIIKYQEVYEKGDRFDIILME